MESPFVRLGHLPIQCVPGAAPSRLEVNIGMHLHLPH
jgi:hypothetical protein